MEVLSQTVGWLHGLWRYPILITGLLALLNAGQAAYRNQPWQRRDRSLIRAYIIALDCGAVLGLMLWIVERQGAGDGSLPWRHPILMVLAAVVAHYGWWRVRQLPGERARFVLICLYLVMSGMVVAIGLAQLRGV